MNFLESRCTQLEGFSADSQPTVKLIRIQYILILLLLLCLNACSGRSDQNVEGDVFIRTKGGQTIPLSLVEVGFGDLFETANAMYATAERKPGARTYKEFFATLPRPSITTKTDAQGHFTVRLPASKQFAVIAHDSRVVGSQTEEYYWCVKYPSTESRKSGKIVLANDNLAGTGPFFTDNLIYSTMLASEKE